MAGLPPAPSTFGSLLRRSKFATYDLAIKQTYTAPVSSATKNDWGFKHDFNHLKPDKSGKKYRSISVKNLDDLLGQMYFDSGETSTRFVKKWGGEGTAMRLQPRDADAATTRTWLDQGRQSVKLPQQVGQSAPSSSSLSSLPHSTSRPSRFPTTASSPPPPPAITIPNVNSMSKKDYQRYISRLRLIRPEFLQFLKGEVVVYLNAQLDRTDPSGLQPRITEDDLDGETAYGLLVGGSGVAASIPPPVVVEKFLALQSAAEINAPQSKTLSGEPSQHPTGGLSYSLPTRLYVSLLQPPVPGRVLSSQNVIQGNLGGYGRDSAWVELGGTLQPLAVDDALNTGLTDLGRPDAYADGTATSRTEYRDGLVSPVNAPRDRESGKGTFRPTSGPVLVKLPNSTAGGVVDVHLKAFTVDEHVRSGRTDGTYITPTTSAGQRVPFDPSGLAEVADTAFVKEQEWVGSSQWVREGKRVGEARGDVSSFFSGDSGVFGGIERPRIIAKKTLGMAREQRREDTKSLMDDLLSMVEGIDGHDRR